MALDRAQAAVVRAAAGNNATWCDTVFRAHGLSTTSTPDAWVSPDPAPPLYPNLVTLTDVGVEALIASIEGVADRLAGRRWAIKDSFGCLDLRSLDFRPLFHARWMVRFASFGAGSSRPVHRSAAADDVGRWEQAWQPQQARVPVPVFPHPLGEDANVAFLSVDDAGACAGLIANRARGVVGITNDFDRNAPSEGGPPAGLRQDLLAEVGQLWPDHPIVVYVTDDELGTWDALGFEELGRLTVWEAGP